MAVVKFQSSEQTNFQNQLQNSNWWQISNPQIAKVNNLTPVQQKQPLNSTFKTDTTIWGNNFYIPNGWQGQQNALVNTWAVAWIKENNLWSLNIQWQQEQPQKKITWKALDIAKKHNQNYCPVPNLDTPTTETTTPTPTPTPTKKTSTPLSQPTPQPQVEQPQEQEPVDEFAPDFYKQEQPQEEQVQEEQRDTPEMNLWENKEGLIYGRASGEAQQTIHTNANEYNPEIAINQERQVSYQNLQGMSSYNIAVSMANGYTPFGDQSMRDLQQYDPQKYQEIQDELKKIQVGEQINQISTGGKIDITWQTKAETDTINNSIDDWAKKNSDSQSYDSTLNSLTSKLASSQTAQSVTQEMMNINKDIAEIQERMNNLPKEAQKAFKGDVPQYLVDAYISNKAQELQSKLNTLQSRYTGLSDMYKAELSQKQFEAEMELKRQQMDMNEREFQWNKYLQQQKFLADQDQQLRERDYNTKKLNYSNIQNIGWEAYVRDANGQRSKLSDDVAYQSYQTKVNNTLQNYMNLYPDGTKYGQCEKFTNDIVQAITWLRMKTKTKFWGTTAQEKANYVNDREPRVWSVAVFDYGIVQDDWVNYGHTAIVTWYDPNTWIVSLTDANYNSDWVVHTRQIPLSQLNNASFKWFWNPYLDKQSESIRQQQPSWSYTYAQTPMTQAFQVAQEEAKDADSRKAVGNAFEWYKKLNDLVNKWAIDVICNSSDFDTLIQRVNDNKFLDGQGNIDWSAMGEYARNSLKNEDLSLWIDALRRMIEIKLRRESWAAISMTEWKDQFSRYLPQLWQSPEEKRRRLIELERDGVVSLLPIKYQTNYIPLISEVSTLPNEIWDD